VIHCAILAPRKTIAKIKTENEMAMLKIVRSSGVPVPEVVFFSSDPDNPLGYEYNCLESQLHEFEHIHLKTM
jgi:hypothetical protein